MLKASQLPDDLSARVSDGLSLSVSNELSQSPTELSGLSYVENFSALDPLIGKTLRIPWEVQVSGCTCFTRWDEVRLEVLWGAQDVHPACAGWIAGRKATLYALADTSESSESGGFRICRADNCFGGIQES
jgi:hypothetical protein